ncbi:hypothetical protein DDD_3190 [Nonlabens dokdonensis DSW-6]|uniref:Uncharacterized protein n=1 Tax=Nonlabens dokdonensis (strain DSM 17205 / KCTC 12402 / DSW-6) TaxID=592029 RepID=L7WDL2_NONDD|nr:hypothetical protein DDD_3190 [Nonlabens dokdonensis DSW-6]
MPPELRNVVVVIPLSRKRYSNQNFYENEEFENYQKILTY